METRSSFKSINGCSISPCQKCKPLHSFYFQSFSFCIYANTTLRSKQSNGGALSHSPLKSSVSSALTSDRRTLALQLLQQRATCIPQRVSVWVRLEWHPHYHAIMPDSVTWIDSEFTPITIRWLPIKTPKIVPIRTTRHSKKLPFSLWVAPKPKQLLQ